MKQLFTQFSKTNTFSNFSLKSLYLSAVLLTLPVFFQPKIQLQKPSPLNTLITKFVKYEINLAQVKGLVIAAVDGDSSEVLGFGETKVGNKTAPDGNTIFEIGSCTKLFTASIIAILKEEKKLDYKDDVSKYLDKLYFEGKDITILDLLTHQSGFTRYPANFTEEEQDGISPIETYSYPQLAQFLKDEQAVPRSERGYIYSHTNYVLLTLIIEKITEQRYETVVKEKLLQPLGMNNTQISLSEEAKKQVAQGYDLSDKETTPFQTTVFKGAMAFTSTPNDMLTFIKAQLQSKDDILIKTLHQMHTPSYPTPIKKINAGIGWHHFQPRREYYSVLAHSGMSNGHQTFIAFLKETQTAIIVMSNSKHNLEGTGTFLLETMNRKWKRKR